MEAQNLQIAVVLSQENHDHVPELSFQGKGEMAKEIIRLAKRFNIPIRKQPMLAKALNLLPPDIEIPAELLPALRVIIDEIRNS